MSEWVVLWKPPGYRPTSEAAIRSLCDGDAEPAMLAMRDEAIIVQVTDHQWENLK